MSNHNPEPPLRYVIGFDGSGSAACGIALPIILDETSGMCFRLKENSFAPSREKTYSLGEIEEWATHGLATLLQERVALGHNSTFPRILYLANRFLEDFDYTSPQQFTSNTSLTWQTFGKQSWAALGEHNALLVFLETCSRRLLASATTDLANFFSSKSETYLSRAETLSDHALSAAHNPELRSKIFLRYGVSLLYSNSPERVHNLYQFILRREYPDWPLESYVGEIRKFSDLLTRAYSDRLRGDLSTQELEDDIEKLAAIDDPDLLNTKCEVLASEYPVVGDPKAILKDLAEASSRKAELRLGRSTLPLLIQDPFFFTSGSITHKGTAGDRKVCLDVFRFIESMRRDHPKHSLAPGDVAKDLFFALTKQNSGVLHGQL